jgi:formylglycine-generating enzyme required for sulfatase activity
MRPLKTFIIYARKDESFKNDLLLHLRGSLIETGHLEVWQDGEILPGEDWEKKIEQQLEAAELFLVLLSIHSLTSEFIRKKELVKALKQKSRIVPILVRSCFWQKNPVFAGLQGLPKNMKPVASFADHDDAWTEVMVALHDMVEAIRAEIKPPAAPKKKPAFIPASQAKPEKPASIEAPPGLPDMVFVKGGTFTMGSPESEEGRYKDEKQHQVTLSDFLIGKYPVTQKLWKEIMDENPSCYKGDDLPVEQVSWEDVQFFLKKLNARYPWRNYRLPTEAEWEYAARGGVQSEGYVYAGSNKLDEVGWYNENAGFKTHTVGQKMPNELGLYDMSGNVWEWCADRYGDYPLEPQTNPKGPRGGTLRVYRGGSWGGAARFCCVACRGYWRAGGRNPSLSFRLAASPQAVKK